MLGPEAPRLGHSPGYRGGQGGAVGNEGGQCEGGSRIAVFHPNRDVSHIISIFGFVRHHINESGVNLGAFADGDVAENEAGGQQVLIGGIAFPAGIKVVVFERIHLVIFLLGIVRGNGQLHTAIVDGVGHGDENIHLSGSCVINKQLRNALGVVLAVAAVCRVGDIFKRFHLAGIFNGSHALVFPFEHEGNGISGLPSWPVDDLLHDGFEVNGLVGGPEAPVLGYEPLHRGCGPGAVSDEGSEVVGGSEIGGFAENGDIGYVGCCFGFMRREHNEGRIDGRTFRDGKIAKAKACGEPVLVGGVAFPASIEVIVFKGVHFVVFLLGIVRGNGQLHPSVVDGVGNLDVALEQHLLGHGRKAHAYHCEDQQQSVAENLAHVNWVDHCGEMTTQERGGSG